jgi:hypothetical protein
LWVQKVRDRIAFIEDRLAVLLDAAADPMAEWVTRESALILEQRRPPGDLFLGTGNGVRYGIGFDGYRERAKATWVGAAVGGWDAATLGMHLDDEDRVRIAEAYGIDPNSGYYGAGQIVGGLTVGTVMAVASGGLAGSSHLGTAANVGRILGQGMKAGMAITDAYHIGNALGDYTSTGDWGTDQNMAAANAAAHLFGLRLGKAYKPQCFVEGTPVLTLGAAGKGVAKAIEELEVGDQVWSRNERTGEEGFKPVTKLYRNQTTTLVHLSYKREAGSATRGVKTGSAGNGDDSEGGESDSEDDSDAEGALSGTPEHPFWSVTRNAWVGMERLAAGERLRLADGSTATVTSARIERLAEPAATYNFEVADWHTYHVGTPDTGWVFVHNTCGPDHLARQRHIRRAAGGEMEQRIYLTNGRYRIVDNLDGADRIHQVGDMRTRGGFRPSARERGAIEDIRKANPNARIIFHDKRGYGPSLIDPDLQPNWRPAPRTHRFDP